MAIVALLLVGLVTLNGSNEGTLGGSTSDNWSVGGNLSVSGTSTFDNSSATTTLQVGGTNDGRVCLYNGSNYSIISFADNSSTVVTATSTTCQ